MRKDEIQKDLREFAFDFFYWFSRFEFALKENQFLKHDNVGANAEPVYEYFSEKYAEIFQHTNENNRLIELKPKRQKVGENSELQWKSVGLEGCKSEIGKIICLLKTVRNNLFHGGKHGAEGWDQPDRTRELLIVGKNILDQLAKLADFESDYTQYY